MQIEDPQVKKHESTNNPSLLRRRRWNCHVYRMECGVYMQKDQRIGLDPEREYVSIGQGFDRQIMIRTLETILYQGQVCGFT